MTSNVVRIGGLTASLVVFTTAFAHEDKLEGQINAIKGMLNTHPEMVIDLSDKSGEYCINTWKVGGSHMTHYAIEPGNTHEDVIDFVRADSLAGAVDVTKLPTMPDKLGGMKPNQWYYLPAGGYDPHHMTRFKFPVLIRATDVE